MVSWHTGLDLVFIYSDSNIFGTYSFSQKPDNPLSHAVSGPTFTELEMSVWRGKGSGKHSKLQTVA